MKKIFEEYGFKDPLFIIEKAAQIRLEKLAAPEKVKNELREIMGVLNSKTHNLSGFLPKAYFAAAIGAAHEYQKMMGEKEKVQVFFGDYANLGKTNEHFENLTQLLLNLCLKINNQGDIGIKKTTDREKEDTIKFLEKVFFNEDKSHSLILSRDWEILKSIIRSKDDGPYSEHMIMVDPCQHPVLAKRALKSIAEKAGAGLTDSMGVYIGSETKKKLDAWSGKSTVCSGQGGDEISGIIANANLDGVAVSNAIHKNTAAISYRYGLNHHEHGKYNPHIYNGLNLGIAVDRLDRILLVGNKTNDNNPCSVLENSYLASLKENSKINNGLVPFSTEKVFLKYLAENQNPDGTSEKLFPAFTDEFHKLASAKFLELEKKYSRDEKNLAFSGERYTEHVHDLLTVKKFREDLKLVCNELKEVASKEQIEILKDIWLRLNLRANAAKTISGNFQRSEATAKLFMEKASNNLTAQTIADYIIEIRDLNKAEKNSNEIQYRVPKSVSNSAGSVENIELDFTKAEHKTLLFTSPGKKEMAKLDIWLAEIFKNTNLDKVSKEEIKSIMQDLIQLKEEKDPVTGTLHGDNLAKLIRDWSADIQHMNNPMNFSKKLNNNSPSVPVKGAEVERREDMVYPNEPLMIGFNVMNLAAFNKELSVSYADKFLKKLANKLCELLKNEGFKSPENLVLHRGGAKFVVLLKPYQAYYNEAKRFKEDFFSGNQLQSKAANIQKAFLNYVTQLNNLEVDDLVLDNQNKTRSIFESLNETYRNVTQALNTDIRDLFSKADKPYNFSFLSNPVEWKISNPYQAEESRQFPGLKVSDLRSPKDHNVRGVNLATSSLYRIGTKLNDPASTIDSLFRNAEEVERRIKKNYQSSG